MNIITKLNIRQKIMLVLTILAAAFLAWQIYNFVHGNTAPPKVVLPMAPATGVPGAPAAGPQPVVKQLPASSNVALAQHQQQYLELVREYQITKMKRQVMEEEAGLANAQKRISDAGKNGAFVGVDPFVGDQSFASGDYQLAYLDRQAGQWTATLAQGDQYKEVHIGTRLADGSRVLTITAKGVVLQPPHGKKKVLEFQGSVNVDNVSVPAATVKAHSRTVTVTTAVNPSNASNPNNARIAKILGITAVPKTAAPAAAPAPVKSTTDVPAAPLANGLTATPAPAAPSAAPAANSDSATPIAAPSAVPPAPTPDSATPVAAPSVAPPDSTMNSATPVTAQPAAPAQTPDAVAPTAAPEATDDSAPVTAAPQAQAPVIKPVSVKELRDHNAALAGKMSGQAVAVGEISWQQAADLSAAASSK